jgi:hypothetical protein
MPNSPQLAATLHPDLLGATTPTSPRLPSLDPNLLGETTLLGATPTAARGVAARAGVPLRPGGVAARVSSLFFAGVPLRPKLLGATCTAARLPSLGATCTAAPETPTRLAIPLRPTAARPFPTTPLFPCLLRLQTPLLTCLLCLLRLFLLRTPLLPCLLRLQTSLLRFRLLLEQ